MGAALLHGTALAGVALPDFRLPPPTSTATPQPDRVGPVAPDVPQSRATPTPTPAPTSQPATPPPPLVVPPAATPAPAQSPRSAPAPAPTRPAPQAAPEAEPSAAAVPTPTSDSPPPPAPTPDGTAAPQPASTDAPLSTATQEDEGGVTWLGWLAVAGLLAGGGVLLVLRRRRTVEPEPAAPAPPAPVPGPVRTPVPAPAPQPVPAPAVQAPAGLAEVELHVVAERLSLSLMNATLTFQLTVRHAGATPLTDVTLHGDLIAAHRGLSQEEQLGGPATDSPVIARLPGLSDEAQTIRGEARLPLAQVNAIRQGRSSLLVPLLRLALEAEGQGRRTLTALVGPPGQGGQVQPVLLDAGPRVVAPLLARVLG